VDYSPKYHPFPPLFPLAGFKKKVYNIANFIL